MLRPYYRVDSQRVQTQLLYFSQLTVDRLQAELLGVAKSIEQAIRASWAPHRKSGDMEASLRSYSKVHGIVGAKAIGKGGTSVFAYVIAGGQKKNQHAHLFERGFSGEESVSAHTRFFDAAARESSRFLKPKKRRAGSRKAPYQEMWKAWGLAYPVEAYERQVDFRAHDYMRKALEGHEAATVAAVRRATDGAVEEAALG